MSGVKSRSLTVELRLKLLDLGPVEGDGTAGVGVKSVDISRNAGGEAGLLGRARR